MAYTILKTDGTLLTTIPDGTVNTSSTSVGLPGRNYAGYGQIQDTAIVHVIENFADNNPPPNPLRGQLWFDTNSSELRVCPTDGESNANAWVTLATTSSGGNTTFGNLTVTGTISASTGQFENINVNGTTATNILTATTATLTNADIASANIGTLRTTLITTGSSTTNGNIIGTWTAQGGGSADGFGGTTLYIKGGNLVIDASSYLRLDANRLYDLAGNPITFSGSYGDANVAAYLPNYNGPILASSVRTTNLTTGANTTAGSITGNWTLTTGSRLQATYADLAERHHADTEYSVGTVVKVGGVNEITQTSSSDSNDVLGVISNTAAYLMNADAGSDTTHPPVASVGRVKVRVLGPIKKGDKITTGINGCATASTNNVGFGWALESNSDVNEKLVLCVIK